MTFHEKLRELRKSSGLSQNDVGELIGHHLMCVSRWERGKEIPRVQTLIKLASLFSVSLDELLGLEERVDDLCHISPRK